MRKPFQNKHKYGDKEEIILERPKQTIKVVPS